MVTGRRREIRRARIRLSRRGSGRTSGRPRWRCRCLLAQIADIAVQRLCRTLVTVPSGSDRSVLSLRHGIGDGAMERVTVARQH